MGEQRPSIDFALGLVATIVAVEYLARHLAAPAIPTIAELRVNDMLATGIAYVALSLVVARVLGARRARRALLAVLSSVRRWEGWVGGLAALVAALAFGLVDHLVWGKVTLPAYSLAARSTTVLADASRWLAPASLLAVNGVVVPIAEEWLWRGVVQPRFVRSLGAVAGVSATAVAFSVKHAIVDASLGRLLAIVAAGVVLGVVAYRATWKTSAFSHVLMNLSATAWLVTSSLATPTCLSPEPRLDPDLVQARTRAIDLIDTHDPARLEALFTPGFLDIVGMDEAVEVYDRVRASHGHCAWKCSTHVPDPLTVEGDLSCTRSPAFMKIGIEADPPHQVDDLVIVPFAKEVPDEK